jgi:hypothetical protein
MKPIYFPYTYISDPVAEAVAACFGQFIVYRPQSDKLPQTMQAWVDKSVIDIRVPVPDDETDLESRAGNYLDWANLHTEKSGIDTAFLKTLKASAPFLDHSLSSQIVADVKGRINDRPTEKTSDPVSAAKIFLYFAQEFDRQNQELDRELDEYKQKEQDLIRDLKMEEDSFATGFNKEYSQMPDATGDYLISGRLQAWTRIFLSDRAAGGLLVTHSRAVLEQLLGSTPTAEKVLHFEFLPLPEKVTDEIKVWQAQLMSYLTRVVENKWPDPSNEPVEGMVFQAAEKTVALSMYIVPAQPPNRFFSHCAEINRPVADPAHQKVRLKNTLIGLVER